MKKSFVISTAGMLVLFIFYACDNNQKSAERIPSNHQPRSLEANKISDASLKDQEQKSEGTYIVSKNVANSTMEESISSSAAQVNPADREYRFIRTADIKGKVNDVKNTSAKIEDLTKNFGGFVTNTMLSSDINRTERIQISEDSTLENLLPGQQFNYAAGSGLQFGYDSKIACDVDRKSVV